MNKAYNLTVLIAVVAIFAFGVAMISADDAEAANFDVKLTYTDHPVYFKMARGMNPVTFNFTIKHTGDYPSEEVGVQLRNPPTNWNIVFSATTSTDVYLGTHTPDKPFEIMLQKAETADMIVTVTPAPKQLNKTYLFDLNVFPLKEAGRNHSVLFGVVIPQVAGFEIKLFGPKDPKTHQLPPGGNFPAVPPATLTLEFAVYNRGNGVDRFLIQGTSSRDQAGWTLTFTKGVDQHGYTPNIMANTPEGSPHIVEIKVPIPPGERSGLTSQITLNATSLYNETMQMPPAFAAVSSLQYPLFQAYINGPDKKDGIPGKEVEFQIKINNQGNGWDTFSIKPLWNSELNPGFIASANPRTIDIDTMENDTVQYIVKVPESAPKKTYFFTAEITSSFEELSPVTKSFAVEVGQYYALALLSEDNYRRTIPGESLEFDVIVTNKGNGLDSIVIDKILNAPTSWLTYTQPPEVTLLQNQESIIKIIVIVPSHFEEAPIGFYNLTVPAHSSRSEAQAEVYLEIEITQFYRIEWMYQGEEITNEGRPIAPTGSIRPRRSFNPYEKDNIDITMEIKNLGNGGDNITMNGYSPDERILVEITPGYTFLPRDQIKYIKVSVTVPKNLPPGVYNLFANASSQDPNFVERVVPLDFEIENYDAQVDPFPTFIDEAVGDVVRSELSADTGANLSFKLTIKNNGTRPLSGVLIKVYDNYIDEGEPVSWNFFNFTTPPIAVDDKFVVGDVSPNTDYPPMYWVARKKGMHEIVFKIQYNSQAENDNDESTVVVLVTEKADSSTILTESTAFLGAIIAALVAVIIVVGYVFAIRRKPQVDADLYSSIYGADFEDGDVTANVEVSEEEVGTTLTPEQQALYGDDYETAEGEEYDYDDYDDEYDYEYDDEYDEEYAEGEYAEGEYAEGETTEAKTTEGETAEGEYAEGEYDEGEYDEEYYEGEYDEATDADYEEENSAEKPKE